jgi:predicted RNA-binding Zn-ribbon protein involved in translation (DUF1610 family)
MRCKNCDYRLWNLTERRCPECGTPFRPSDYEFVPNSVQFCCPHCGQSYYGTGAKGHLVPAAFACVKCGRNVHMDEMVLLPTEGVHEQQTNVYRIPWLERRERGLVKAWLATVGAALVSPMRLMRGLPADGAAGPARWFARLTLLVTAVGAAGPLAAFPLIAGLGRGPAAMGGVVASVLLLVGMYVALVLGTFLWSLLAHGLLLLTGATAGPRARTSQAIYYSTGANIFTAVPCLGMYIGWIWWVVSATLMVKEAQRVHGGRAALAVVTPPIVLFVTVIALYIWFVVSVVSSIGTTGTLATQPSWAMGPSRSETRAVLSKLLRFARERDARGPRHASELVAAGYLDAGDFVGLSSFTTTAQVPVGGATLERLGELEPAAANRLAQGAAQALPPGTTAHRLGDYVFTYHGMDLTKADPQLWVVIGTPEPNAATPQLPSTRIACGQADGTVCEIGLPEWEARLADQNSLRQRLGLPALRDPRGVTHARPDWAAP